MIDQTILACVELCQGLLKDFDNDIEAALSKLSDEGGSLAIAMNFRIEPMEFMTNKVDATLSFAKEKIRFKASKTVQEGQISMAFNKTVIEKDGLKCEIELKNAAGDGQ